MWFVHSVCLYDAKMQGRGLQEDLLFPYQVHKEIMLCL